MPEGLDWEVYRIVTSERFNVSAADVRYSWTMEDLLDAHLAEDMHEEAERKSQQKSAG